MTNPTPHGQVPEALIDLIDAYAETRHRCGGIYNARTEAARKAVIEALSGVQALSAAPGEPPGIQALMCVISSLRDTAHFSDEEGDVTDDLRTLRDWAYAQTAAFQPSPTAQGATIASEPPTPPAEQQAQPDECFPGEPKVAVPQGLISAACFAIRNKRDGGKVLEQLRRYSVGDRSQPLAPQQAAPKAQAADSVPAIQGEMNVQLDIDSNHSAPGQQRDVARSVALGQPMGNGQDQAAGRPSAQGDKLLTVAERNIRSFLRSAQFKCESDREAALNCVDVLWAAARDPADSVQEDAARLDWLEQNLFHREKDEWGTKYGGYKEYNMWVLFSPKGIQGSARNIIDAAREQGADHDR